MTFVPKRMKLITVVVLAFIIVATGLIAGRQYTQDIERLNDLKYQVRLDQIEAERRKSAYQAELSESESDEYIIRTARELYGYLMPGEIRFIVTNTDALYDEPEARVLERGL